MTPLDKTTCEETFRRLDDYLDRELSAPEIAQVEQHLATCAICTREFQFEANVLGAVRSKVERIAAPRDLLRKILRRLPSKAGEPPRDDR